VTSTAPVIVFPDTVSILKSPTPGTVMVGLSLSLKPISHLKSKQFDVVQVNGKNVADSSGEFGSDSNKVQENVLHICIRASVGQSMFSSRNPGLFRASIQSCGRVGAGVGVGPGFELLLSSQLEMKTNTKMIEIRKRKVSSLNLVISNLRH